MSKLSQWLDPDHDGKIELPPEVEALVKKAGRQIVAALVAYLTAELARWLASGNPGTEPAEDVAH